MKVLVIGSNGKMGNLMCKTLEKYNISHLGIDINTRNIAVNFKADIIVDFSLPNALNDNLTLAKQLNCGIVIATTNHSVENQELIEAHSKNLPVFISPNFSLQFNTLIELIKHLSPLKNNVFVVAETHHKHKKDAPSGSAKLMLSTLEQMGILAHCTAFRVGEIVGEHSLKIYSPSEVLEIKHTALSRQTFCDGALSACRFLLKQKNGLFTMGDLILNDNM